MAKQAGPHFFTGTIGDLIFYKLGDNYYVRQKGEPTSGTRKRMKDAACYPVLNMRKREFGAASKLASGVYRQLPRKLRGHGKQQQLTGQVVHMMRKGMKAEEISAFLLQELVGEQPVFVIKPAEDSVSQKEPIQTTSKQPKSKQLAKLGLSGWQVSDNGRLYKTTDVSCSNATADAQPATGLYCKPCFSQGIALRLWDAKSG